MSVFRTKSVEASMATEEADHKLKRTLTALDLTVFGIGVIIGAGIFTLTGRAAEDYAGPSIVAVVRPRRDLLRRSPRSATPSSPRRCPVAGRRTRSPTRRSASSSPGSSAGTCSSS